jgi:predicted transposase/invertase (TIGR01784 family)
MAQYDNTCKILVEQFTADIATWLLGEPIDLTTLESTELLVDPIHTDSLILLQSDDLILHIEFQVEPKAELPFRMLDYRVRSHRRYPQKAMRQFVVYLRSSPSSLVYQDWFRLENLSYSFQVIRLWEQPTEQFFQAPGLLPFAVLSGCEDRSATLQQVARQLQNLPLADAAEQNLRASANILAGLLLDPELVSKVLRKDIMRESSVYQAILAEGRQEGLVEGLSQGLNRGLAEGLSQGLAEGLTQGLTQGRTEGRTEEARKLVLRMLRRRLGLVEPGTVGVEPDRVLSRQLELRLEGLSLFELEDLGEALLEFEQLADLMAWLAAQEEKRTQEPNN